eukprot:5693080-Pyramimonas_sp.AAC.1
MKRDECNYCGWLCSNRALDAIARYGSEPMVCALRTLLRPCRCSEKRAQSRQHFTAPAGVHHACL